jgi:hypothetical protein
MSKEAIRDIVKAAMEVYQKAAVLAGARGTGAGGELKKLIKDASAAEAAALKKLAPVLDRAVKLAAVQSQASPKLANFAKVVAEGKMALDVAAPVANRIVRDVTMLHDLVTKCRAGYAALPPKVTGTVLHLKAFDAAAKEFLASWDRVKAKLKPVSVTAAKPPGR